MSISVAPAFADEKVYQYKPSGAVEPRRERVRSVQPFHFPYNQMFLIGDISKDLFIVQVLPVTVEQDDDKSYIVSDDIFLVYGDGNDRSDAIKDYIESLTEFYYILEASQTNPFDRKQFTRLQRYIQPKSQMGNYAPQTNRD